MRVTKLPVFAVAVSFVLTGFALTGTVSAQSDERRVRLEAELEATDADPEASGRARFERRTGRPNEFSTEVEDVESAESIDVEVDGVFVGSVAVVDGKADLNRRVGVPNLSKGSLVEVFNSDTGELILSGVLRRVHH